MAKNRDPRRGFLARWFHRLRWLRRLLVIAGLAGGVVKTLQRRSAGGSTGGTGTAGGGPGGSGRPAPVGGPSGPRLAASVTAPSGEGGDVGASPVRSPVRTLVSVPPLDDDEDGADEARSAAAGAETGVVVPLAASGTGDERDESDDGPGASTAPVLTIVGDPDGDSAATAGSWVPPLEGGECPAEYPIKAKANSGIFHVPGGRSYNRTVAERCYASAEAAEADGYRPAKA